MIYASSHKAHSAYTLLKDLQNSFADKLGAPFLKSTWLRDEGKHGGGERLYAPKESLFNAASINISQVHYDDLQDSRLASASALSTIIHPNNPFAPSIHMHISFTELRDGDTYWRVMADLNPSIFDASAKECFEAVLRESAPTLFSEAMLQGEKYFYIPALARHRGVSHFYLEGLRLESFEAEMAFCEKFTRSVISLYSEIFHERHTMQVEVSQKELLEQRNYHTLYLFQVLTLDRGTTAGLLVHDQNDLGILASLPSVVDKELLHSWFKEMKPPQTQLLLKLANAINEDGVIDDATKIRFATILREHYECYPEALELQASGDTLPTTLQNHTQTRL